MKKNDDSVKMTKRAKGKVSVVKILDAAKIIFSEHPYHSATMRMIGNAAGINFPLIAYYFSSKAALFEAVIRDLSEGYYRAAVKWLEEIKDMHIKEGLPLYIDRLIEYERRHPEGLTIIILNMIQPKENKAIPSHKMLQNFFVQSFPLIKKISSTKATETEIKIFQYTFNILAINYLGARSFYAAILGLDPASSEYDLWVKQNMVSALLPLLKQLKREQD